MKHYEDFYNEAKQYSEILKRYEENGEVFTDPNFIPTNEIRDSIVELDGEKYNWQRIDEIYKAPLFKKELIKENAIQPGELGTCFFTTALSRVAKQSELVEILFDTRTRDQIENQDSINLKCGAVIIYFHAFGKRTPVLIDTLISFRKDNQEARFSHPSDSNYSPWFCLVEKAYAKLHGSYSAIISGKLSQAIYHLFGYYPCYQTIDQILQNHQEKLKKISANETSDENQAINANINDNDYLFSLLMKWQYQNAVLGADISLDKLKNGITKNDIEDKGLLLSRTYLIVKARCEESKNFICLKSPLKNHVWLGDWSNDSSLWTKELKRALGFHQRNDGTFWMIAEDFFKYFTSLDISKPVNPEYYSKSVMTRLFPSLTDGYDIFSKESQLSSHQTFVIRLKNENDQISSEKDDLKVHVTIEKRKPLVEGDQDANYQVFAFYTNGEKIGQEMPETYFGIKTNSSFYRFTIHTKKNQPFIVVFQRTDRRDYTEECYVRFSCKHDFDLYDYDSPTNLSNEDENIGIVFNNESKRYSNISRKIVVKNIRGNDVRGYEDDDLSEANPTFYKDLKPNPSSETVSGFFEYSLSDDSSAIKNEIDNFWLSDSYSKIKSEQPENKAESEHSERKVESEHQENKAESEHAETKVESEHSERKVESEHQENKVESEHAETKVESEHSERKVESEHQENKVESEHAETKAESEHSERKVESEHAENKVESEHPENKAESEHAETKVESGHPENKVESEHAETKAESEHSERKVESEHAENKAESEHAETKVESEHQDNKVESEHPENKAESEHAETKVESEHQDNKVESEHAENKAESEHAENKAESEHAETKIESEHQDNKVESEHPENKAESEHAETKIESEHQDNKVESEHAENKAESEHAETKVESEHQDNKVESEHSENKVGSEHAETKVESEHQENKIESEHSENKVKSEHSETKVESEHSGNKAESEHTENKVESEHSERLAESGHLGERSESKHSSTKIESEHLGEKSESKHSSTKNESEHSSARKQSQHSSARNESEHSGERSESKYSSARKQSEHSSAKNESEHSGERSESKHSSTKNESEHSSARKQSQHSGTKNESEYSRTRNEYEYSSTKNDYEYSRTRNEYEYSSTRTGSEYTSARKQSEHSRVKTNSEHSSARNESDSKVKTESELIQNSQKSGSSPKNHESGSSSKAALSHVRARQMPESPKPKTAADLTFEEALKYYDGKSGTATDKAKALELFTAAADSGHPKAQFNVGYMYANGEGVPRDPQKAVKYYEMAAKQQVPKAQFCLGVFYLKGLDGVPKDKEKAAQLFEQASDKELKALYNLALMYQNGYGVQKDLKKACELFERAGEQNDKDALYNLGQIYEKGYPDVEQDKTKAFNYYKKSAELGNDKAQLCLGLMYMKGDGCKFDVEKGRHFIVLSAQSGNEKAKQLLSQGLPILSPPSQTMQQKVQQTAQQLIGNCRSKSNSNRGNNDDDADDYNDNEDDDSYNDENDNFNQSSEIDRLDDNDQKMHDLLQSLERGIKRVHRKISRDYINCDDALNDIDNFFIERKISRCISEFSSARDFLISTEDKAYLVIAKENQKKNRLPKLIRGEKGQFTLDDSNGLLSLSEFSFSNPPSSDEFDDELYKLEFDCRTLETRIKSVEQQIKNPQKQLREAVFLSASSSSSASVSRNPSRGSFENLFSSVVDNVSNSSKKLAPPSVPPSSKSPYQTRTKRFFK